MGVQVVSAILVLLPAHQEVQHMIDGMQVIEKRLFNGGASGKRQKPLADLRRHAVAGLVVGCFISGMKNLSTTLWNRARTHEVIVSSDGPQDL